jgi:long-subunit acyl-CoA synthetase (AMP-forming)
MSFFTTTIDENQCIGDSLDTLNSNFSALDTAVYDLYTAPVVAFTCERNSTGTQDQFMAHGDGAALHNGICMPFAGSIISAALQVYGMTGTVAVDPCINGTPQEDYRLTTTGTDVTGSHVRTFVEPPLSFSGGSTIGWKQVNIPSSANAYNVTFVVAFSGV